MVLALRRRCVVVPVLLRLLVGRLIGAGLSDWPQLSPFSVGLRCRCPRCGIGRLYDGFLTVAAKCDHCSLDLRAAASGDGPAVFVMFAVAPIVTGLALWVDAVFAPPMWVHMMIWVPTILGGWVLLLRPFKAVLVALQYHHKAGDTGNDTFSEEE